MADAYIIVDGQRARIQVTSYNFDHDVAHGSVESPSLRCTLRERGPSTTVRLEGVVVEHWADDPEPTKRTAKPKPKSAFDRLLSEDLLEVST